MAGSYYHLVDRETGEPIKDSEGCFYLIEHAGDAQEALEECVWLIERLSSGNRAHVAELLQEMKRGPDRGDAMTSSYRLHRFKESSGTTDTCEDCGLVRYSVDARGRATTSHLAEGYRYGPKRSPVYPACEGQAL